MFVYSAVFAGPGQRILSRVSAGLLLFSALSCGPHAVSSPTARENGEPMSESEKTPGILPWSNATLRATDLRSVAYGKEATIVVGGEGKIFRRLPPNQWTEIESGTEQRLHGLYSDGDGLFVAVGDSGTVLRSIDDGKTWSLSQVERLATWWHIVGNRRGDILLAGPLRGLDSCAVYSRDGGKTWSSVQFLTGKADAVTSTPNGDLFVSSSSKHPHGGMVRVELGRLDATEFAMKDFDGGGLIGLFSDPAGNVFTSGGQIVFEADRSQAWAITPKRDAGIVIRWKDHLLAPGARGGGIHHSWDKGKTWAHEAADRRIWVHRVSVDEHGHATLVGADGLMMSAQLENRPTSWHALSVVDPEPPRWPIGDVYSLWGDGAGIVYAAMYANRLLRSTDAGLSWSSLADSGHVLGLWGLPAGGPHNKNVSRVFRVGVGLQSSTDDGRTWLEHLPGLPSLFDIRGHGDDVLAVGHGTIALSHDRGVTWRQKKSPVKGTLTSVWAGPKGEFLIAGMDGDILCSTDRGESFKLVSSTPGLWLKGVGGVGKRRWAVGSKGALSSTDSGVTWQTSVEPKEGQAVRSLRGSTYAVGYYQPVLRADPQRPDLTPSKTNQALKDIALAGPDSLIAGGSNGNLFRSTDRGLTWTWLKERKLKN